MGATNNFIQTYLDQENQILFQIKQNIQILLNKLSANEFDLVAIGRSLITEEWPNKVKSVKLKEIIQFNK